MVLEIHTDDPALGRACELYWERAPTGAFAHKVADVAEQIGLRAKGLASLIAQHSTARITDDACAGCGLRSGCSQPVRSPKSE